MDGLDDFCRDQADDREAAKRALEALNAAYRRVRDRLSTSGWTLTHDLAAQAPGHFIVRCSMHRDGIEVSACGFVIGPERSVAFARPGDRRVTRALDATGEAEFHRLIEIWAEEVQAGIAHRWRHEAKRAVQSPV